MAFNGVGSDLASFASWTFLPDLLSGFLQSIYYNVFLPAGKHPHPNTTKHSRDRLYCRLIVSICLLLYTLVEADWLLRRQGDYYTLLGVSPLATAREINQKYRRLSLTFHPDKVKLGPGVSVSQAHQVFVEIQNARATLIDPIQRFAYDRFGPAINSCPKCLTIGDFISDGMMKSIPVHIGSALFMYFSNVFGYLTPGKYWRYLTLVFLMVFEAYVVMHPSLPLLNGLNSILFSSPIPIHPPIIQFQLLHLARRVAITIYLALTQLQPILGQLEIGGNLALRGSDGEVKPELSSAIRNHALMMMDTAAHIQVDVRAKVESNLVPLIDTFGVDEGADGISSIDLDGLKEKMVDKMVDDEINRRARLWSKRLSEQQNSPR